MILPNMIAIGYFIIMRNYFEYSVSSEVEDAAIIDGANEFIMFFRIIIPLSTPMLAAILLFEAVGNWNDWTSYLYFVGKAELMPFVVVLQEILKNPNGYVSAQAASEGFVSAKPVPPAGLVKATIVVAMLPIMCVYPFLQKHFAKGIMVGAVKG
jgi:ABC-type sugar transport system, permease component